MSLSLPCPLQSAYRKFHSTETALTKIHSNLSLAINQRQVSALVLLDLSAAFDTIDHSILLKRLQSNFGISHSALSMLSSYLCERTQSVLIDQSRSPETPLTRGAWQGSVLDPLLFSLYTTSVSDILTNSSINFHLYPDDTQLYISFSAPDSNQYLAFLSNTLDRLFLWFCEKLSINPNKTEFLLIGTAQQRSELINSSLLFCGNTIPHSESARNLGVIFDTNLNFDNHISAICRSSFFFIRQLRQLRPCLDYDSAVILVIIP